MIITNSRYALVGYFITSYPTRAHRIIVIYFDVMIKDILKLKYVLSGSKKFVANYNKHYLYLQIDLSSFRILIQFVVTDNCEQTAKRNVRLL